MKYNFLNYNLPKLHAVDCKIRGFLFRKKLRKVAKFIELHNLYPVILNKELLEVWKK